MANGFYFDAESCIGSINSFIRISPMVGVGMCLDICISPDISMVIDDFHIVKMVSFRCKTDSVLIIDPNAVLSLPAPLQFFQMVCGRNSQILQASCIIHHDQFPQCNELNMLRELL